MKNWIKIYDQNNFGDDLFLKVLLERYPDVPFCMIADKKRYGVFEGKYSNLKIIHRGKAIVFLNKLFRKFGCAETICDSLLAKKGDVYIYLGGSIFIEQSDMSANDRYLKSLLRIAKKCKMHILGANFGPYITNEFCEKTQKLISATEEVCFRDKYSYDCFSKLSNIRYSDDIAYNLDLGKYLRQTQENNYYLTISIINPKIKNIQVDYEKYIHYMASIISEVAKKNKKVCIMSLCEMEGDLEVERDILEIIDTKYKENIECVRYSNNIDEIIEIINNSTLSIASRYHHLLIALLLNRSVSAITYGKKMDNLIDESQITINYVNIESIEDNPDSSYILHSMSYLPLRKREDTQFLKIDTRFL